MSDTPGAFRALADQGGLSPGERIRRLEDGVDAIAGEIKTGISALHEAVQGIRSDMSDGRLTFERHGGRLENLEKAIQVIATERREKISLFLYPTLAAALSGVAVYFITGHH